MEDHEKVDVIKRQTDYSEETIKEKLLIYDGNIEKVIRDYIQPEKKEEIANKRITKNQTRYKEIRNMMDTAMKTYEEKKSKEAQDNQ